MKPFILLSIIGILIISCESNSDHPSDPYKFIGIIKDFKIIHEPTSSFFSSTSIIYQVNTTDGKILTIEGIQEMSTNDSIFYDRLVGYYVHHKL